MTIEQLDRWHADALRVIKLKTDEAENGHDWVVDAHTLSSWQLLELVGLATIGYGGMEAAKCPNRRDCEMTKQDRIAKLEAELARLKNDKWPKTTVIYVHEEDLFTEAEELGLEESAEEVFAHSLYELGLEVQVHSSGKTLLVRVQDGDDFVPLARPIVLADPEMSDEDEEGNE